MRHWSASEMHRDHRESECTYGPICRSMLAWPKLDPDLKAGILNRGRTYRRRPRANALDLLLLSARLIRDLGQTNSSTYLVAQFEQLCGFAHLG